MGRKLRADQLGVFPGTPDRSRHAERDRVVRRMLAERAGLPTPESISYENLGNRELPIYKYKSAIQAAIRDNQISMLEGDTGSGKSTQVGQYALELGYKKIIYLEPRILLADNLADQLEREFREQLGAEQAAELVGVRHSERSTGKNRTIEVMTPATFMRVMNELSDLENEPVLVVGDEIHEKDFETELAVAATVKSLQSHPKWRLVLASATMDAASIHAAYSGMYDRPIPRTLVEGRPHSLEHIFEPELTAAEAYKKYYKEHDKALIFTAGKAEIKDTSKEIRRSNIPSKIRINPLHAKLSRSDIKKATHAQLRDGEHQAVVSTSAGQSGITIPGLTLVITDGTTRRPELNEDGVPGLFKEYCTQDELIQQAGRAGRDVAGGTVVYVKPDDPSFEYLDFEERDTQAPAQIYHTNIARNVLLATTLGADFFELNKFLIHGVNQTKILESYEVLYRLGAIDEYNEVTEVGKSMNKFPLRPEFSRVLVAALQNGADAGLRQRLAAILCSIEAGGLPYFEKGLKYKWKEDVRPETTDDYIAQLDMFYATRKFYNNGAVDEKELQARTYDLKNTYRAHKTFDKVCRVLDIPSHKIDMTPPNEHDVAVIHDYLLSGLFDFAHIKIAGGTSRKPVQFRGVHDSDDVSRGLSSRGTYKSNDGLVIGMPRAFEKKQGGHLERFEVIENVFPTSLQKLAKHVLHVAQRHPVTSSQVVGGQLKRKDTLTLGALKVGEVPSTSRLQHTEETRLQLLDAAFNKSTDALNELVSIKKYLETLQRRIPTDELERYFPDGILTDEFLKEKIYELITDEVSGIIELDNKLRTWMVRQKIAQDTWLTKDAEAEIISRSPDTFELNNGSTYNLYYTHGIPVINQFNLKDAAALPEHLLLDDGREVMINYQIGRDAKRHSANAVKEYAQSLG